DCSKRHIDTEFCPFEEGFVGYGNHICADHGRHSTSEEHACQCDNKRLDPKIRHQIPLYNTEQNTNAQCHQNGNISIHTVALHLIGNYHTNKCSHTSHRDINTSGNHNDGKT